MPEDFETVLGVCLADLATGRATLEECLKRYPAHADRLAELLSLAEQEQAIPPPEQSSTAPPTLAPSSTLSPSADVGSLSALPPEQSPLAALSDSPSDALASGPIDGVHLDGPVIDH